MVSCGCISSARIDQRDGNSSASEYDCTDAAGSMASSQHDCTDAAFTLGEYNSTDAAVSLVVSETVTH